MSRGPRLKNLDDFLKNRMYHFIITCLIWSPDGILISDIQNALKDVGIIIGITNLTHKINLLIKAGIVEDKGRKQEFVNSHRPPHLYSLVRSFLGIIHNEMADSMFKQLVQNSGPDSKLFDGKEILDNKLIIYDGIVPFGAADCDQNNVVEHLKNFVIKHPYIIKNNRGFIKLHIAWGPISEVTPLPDEFLYRYVEIPNILANEKELKENIKRLVKEKKKIMTL